jgi:AcrR family transcriptional regulator
MTTPSRRTPLQLRSNETCRLILQSTSTLLAETPFDQITTSRIAEHASISVGALYRFFSSKQEIFDAIAVQELESFRAMAESKLSVRRLLFTPRKTIAAIVDAYVEFLDNHPGFRTLALGRHISEETRQLQINPNIGPSGLLQNLLLAKLPWKSTSKLERKIRIASELGDHLIAHAYKQPTPKARKEVIEELKDVLSSYLLP